MLSDKVEAHEDVEAETAQIRKEAQDSLEQSFTPSLARRLSRQFIEQTRQSVPRSPSVPRDKYYQSPIQETSSANEIAKRHSTSAISDQNEHRSRSIDRSIRRTNSLLEPPRQFDRFERHSPRRSLSLFDDHEDKLLPPLPKHVMTLGRKYKESSVVGNARRENFHGYRTDKIQEESGDDPACNEEDTDADNNAESGCMSEATSISMCNSNANLMDTTTTSSVSAKSCETSPTESSSNLGDYSKSFCAKSDSASRSFETRLLAAENLIKESKLKNLTPQRFNPNLICNYKDTDKCDKEALMTIATAEPSANSVPFKRRSCIPSLRLRSASLTRESSTNVDRRKSFAGSPDPLTGASQERSILSKFFRGGNSGSNSSNKEAESKDNKGQKPKQHRISRFLRPDFFDTPREESQYVKEKEAQKAAENERRKSRFMRRKSESKDRKEEIKEGESICKEQKNEMNALQKDKLDTSSSQEVKPRPNEDREKVKIERQGSKNSFLHSLEKKLERLRSSDETTAKPTMMNGNASGDRKERGLRENSAPPVEYSAAVESSPVKRTLSVEDLTLNKGKTKNASKAGGRVTSMLGLFKSADAKQNTTNGSHAQSAIMSKLKRSPPKCTPKAESVLEEDTAASSKIPTKFARPDGKSTKKTLENKRSPEKIVSEYKRSPPKEKLKEKEPIAKEKKIIIEKQSREVKRVSEKIIQSDSSTSSSADKMRPDKADPPRKLSDDSESLQKAVDNKHVESVSSDDKKLIKTKKNISALSKNESVVKIDKGEDVDKKSKKPVKSKESADKDEINGAKKKKIVRVVKRVVKKSSDSSESKSDEKEKTSKPLIKKKLAMTKKEKSPEGPNVTTPIPIKGNADDQTITKSYSHSKQMNLGEISCAKHNPAEYSTLNTNAASKMDSTGTCVREAAGAIPSKSIAKVSTADTSQMNSAHQNVLNSAIQNGSSSAIQNASNSMPVNFSSSVISNTSGSNIGYTKPPEQHRPSRASLKLDLSKIPQHTFRHTTPKKDSPKSDSPRANPGASVESPKKDIGAIETDTEKLMECLSKMTHRANITGNKIIIDKPLRARDVAELKREVTECAKIIENHVESRNDRSTPQTVIETVNSGESSMNEKSREIKPESLKENNNMDNVKVAKDLTDDSTSEMFSPEEPESFDSWSICSADLNHNRSDLHSPQLHSPTSPSYSLFMRSSDSSESVIDRIRRRSFYSRFNDRKRPSLTAPPPGLSSVTLPRRYSFNSSSRERERSRLYNYGIPRTR